MTDPKRLLSEHTKQDLPGSSIQWDGLKSSLLACGNQKCSRNRNPDNLVIHAPYAKGPYVRGPYSEEPQCRVCSIRTPIAIGSNSLFPNFKLLPPKCTAFFPHRQKESPKDSSSTIQSSRNPSWCCMVLAPVVFGPSITSCATVRDKVRKLAMHAVRNPRLTKLSQPAPITTAS